MNFGWPELVAVIGLLALLIYMGLPTLGSRPMRPAASCRANLNALGKSCLIYAAAMGSELPCTAYQRIEESPLDGGDETNEGGANSGRNATGDHLDGLHQDSPLQWGAEQPLFERTLDQEIWLWQLNEPSWPRTK